MPDDNKSVKISYYLYTRSIKGVFVIQCKNSIHYFKQQLFPTALANILSNLSHSAASTHPCSYAPFECLKVAYKRKVGHVATCMQITSNKTRHVEAKANFEGGKGEKAGSSLRLVHKRPQAKAIILYCLDNDNNSNKRAERRNWSNSHIIRLALRLRLWYWKFPRLSYVSRNQQTLSHTLGICM